ncbi:MAG: ABC-type transport auxiliary lipoprotein family protein [Pseudomonadota bacterium]
MLHKSVARIALLSGALALGGCSVGSLFKAEESKTYDLGAPTNVGKVSRSGAQVSVPEPSALRWLDSDRLVVKPNDAEINYFGEVQWSDRLPRLVQARLIETLERSGGFRSVAKPGSGIDPDYELLADIRHFEILAGEQPKVQISISVKMVPTKSGRTIKQRLFEITAPAAATDATSASVALNNALGEVLKDIAVWAARR